MDVMKRDGWNWQNGMENMDTPEITMRLKPLKREGIRLLTPLLADG